MGALLSFLAAPIALVMSRVVRSRDDRLEHDNEHS
jgi:hypothetical protein